MQISLDDVRAVARLLQAHNLGEITVESTADTTQCCRLVVRRAAPAPGFVTTGLPPVLQPMASPNPNDGAIATDAGELESNPAPGDAPTASATIAIAATAVGVFRTATPTLQAGDAVRAGQVIGSVESLKVPNDVKAPTAGTVVDVFVAEGQGIEYGQILMILMPEAT